MVQTWLPTSEDLVTTLTQEDLMAASHRKLASSLTVGGMCAVAAFVTLAGTSGPVVAAKGNGTTASDQTAAVQTATCPAGTVETADACFRLVKAPTPPAQAAAARPATTADRSVQPVQPARATGTTQVLTRQATTPRRQSSPEPAAVAPAATGTSAASPGEPEQEHGDGGQESDG